jgi:hypothetical protein
MNDWTQTPTTVSIYIPLSYKISPQDISYQIMDTFIKMNVPKQNIFKFYDLYAEINTETSKVVLEDKRVIFYLDKVIQEKWPSLEYTCPKEDKINRRKIAEENYTKRMNEIEERSKEQKKLNERYVFDKSIQMGDEKRKELNNRKEEEKTTAERDLYEFVNVMENPDIAGKKEANRFEEIDGTIEEVDTTIPSKQLLEQNIETIPETSIVQKTKIYNEIFKGSEIPIDNQETAIRKEANIKVNLTEKLIPHFAARESLAKEPPYPKSKKFQPEKNMVRCCLIFSLAMK